MDTFLDKFLEGEITEEQYNAEVGKLDEEGKKKHDELLAKSETQAKLRKKGQEELEKVSGLRKERQRLENNPPKPDNSHMDFAAKLREENLEKAKRSFFKDFEIPVEDQPRYVDAFSKNDKGDVSEEFIYSSLESIYAQLNAKTLINKARERDSMRQGGDDFNADNAGAPGGGSGGGDDSKKRDPKVLEWMKEFEKQGKHITYDDAERVLNRGMVRTF